MLSTFNTTYFKVMISFIILAFIAAQMSLGEISGVFTNISMMSIAFWCIAVAFLVAQAFILSVRWFFIVNTGRKRMGFRKSIEITFAALIANYLFFTSIGGLAVRIALTVKEKASLLFAVGAGLIDRFMTLLALLIMSVVFIPLSTEHFGVEISTIVIGLLSMVLGLLAFGIIFSKTRYGLFMKSSRKVVCTLKHMQSIFTKPKLLGKIVATSLIAQFFYFASVYVVMSGIGLEISFIQLLTVLPMIALISSLPIGFGGWGVREGAFVYGLGFFGIGIEQAFLVSVQIGVLGLISAAIIGFPMWLYQDNSKKL